MRSAQNPVRVILGDDSGFIRILLSDYLRKDEAVKLIALAANGKEVVDLSLKHQPDVVITDLVMPEYDGLYAVKSIMQQRPVPIVLLSSLSRTDPKVFEALTAGAAEFMGKPQGQPAANGLYAQRLLRLVKGLADSHMQYPSPAPGMKTILPPNVLAKKATHVHDVVVIGASTGGPAVLEQLISHLPATMPVPILVAQHMPASFIEAFAKRLNQYSALPVSVATHGQELQPGRVFLAGGQQNLKVVAPTREGGWPKVEYTSDTWVEFNNPSVDCLFESAVSVYGSKTMGVLLSGMGKDGGAGMQKIYQAGGITLAQDEATCVVFGMPGYALAQKAVHKLIPAPELPHEILKHL